MSKPILKKQSANKLNSASSSISSSSTAAVTFVTTLQDTLTTIWDESRLFLQTRFQIPHVSHVLLMQQPDLVQRNRDLVAILERLSSVVDKLKPHEFSVLNNSYSAVESGLELGMTHVTWPSLCLANYIQELAESVERFEGMAHDVAIISNVLERCISQIHNHRLLPTTTEQQSSSAEDFFQRLSRSGDDFFADVRRVVSELPDVLLQVESLVNHTQTGSAAELQNYYDHWRRRVYYTVLRSIQDRFGELSLLLERGPAQFTVRVSLSSNAVIAVEPDLESIERCVGQIVQHWIKKSSVLPDWRQGTCLAAETNEDAVDTFYDRFRKEPLLTKTVERDKKHCRHLVAQLKEVIEQWNDCAELWATDKALVCRELDASSPTVAQYDEHLWHFRHYWNQRLEAMDEEVVIACVTLHCVELKAAAQQHARQWVQQLGATWLDGTRNKLVRLRQLLQVVDADGSINIDIEMLIAEVKESWHRLRHYKIKVPEEMLKQLAAIESTFKLKRKEKK